jgi:hypothetical protein
MAARTKTAAAKKAATRKPAAKKERSSSPRAPSKKQPTRRATGARKRAAPAPKKSAAKPASAPTAPVAPAASRPAPSAAPLAAKPGSFSALQVNRGHVFALRPRVETGFSPAAFDEARRELADERYATIVEAARALAVRALELTRRQPRRDPFRTS